MNIHVRVQGCVNKMGTFRLKTATIGAAIRAAKGFRRDSDFVPTGVIRVRSKRKGDGRYYCRRRLDYKHARSRTMATRLRNGDTLVVQYGFTKKWLTLWAKTE